MVAITSDFSTVFSGGANIGWPSRQIFVFSTNICLIWLYLAIMTIERHASVIKKRFFSSRFTLEISYFSPFAREDADAPGCPGLPKSFFWQSGRGNITIRQEEYFFARGSRWDVPTQKHLI